MGVVNNHLITLFVYSTHNFWISQRQACLWVWLSLDDPATILLTRQNVGQVMPINSMRCLDYGAS